MTSPGDQGTARPEVDPSAVLGKLKSIITDSKDPQGGGKSWVGTVMLIVVALAGMAVWAWVSRRRSNELAALRHEKFLSELKAEQAEVDSRLSENDVKVEASLSLIREAEEKIRLLEADIRAEESRYEADLRAINSIRSWRDVDPGAG